MQNRVMAYIDGFNLYFGLKSAKFRRYYWLDVYLLCKNLLQPAQQLMGVKYFTSRISGAHPNDAPDAANRRESKRRRQADYLDAIGVLRYVEIIEGKFLPKTHHCHRCGSDSFTFEEKMTDVNIATHLLTDAHHDRFDSAILISGDSDLVPPVRKVLTEYPTKRIVVAFPPKRHSQDLRQVASAAFTVGRAKLAASQLPDPVKLLNGHEVCRPAKWT